MHPRDVFATRDGVQSPVPLLPHSTAGHLGSQHCSPCPSPAQSLRLHFTGGGNSNLKKSALPKLQVSLLASIFASSRQGRQGSPAAAAAPSLRPQRTPGPGPEPKGTACTGSPRICSSTAQHTGQPSSEESCPGCGSAALTPA